MKAKIDKEKVALKQRLARLLRIPENKICAECSVPKSAFISFIRPQQSFALGSKLMACFLCEECANVHQGLGVNVCYVKSISRDDFTSEEVKCAEYSGNDTVNEIFEGHLRKSTIIGTSIKPQIGAEASKRERFIRQKYLDLYFYRKKSHYKRIAEINEMLIESKKNSLKEEEQTPMGKKNRKKLSVYLKSDDASDNLTDCKVTSGCSTTVGNTVSTPLSLGDSTNWHSGSIDCDGNVLIEVDEEIFGEQRMKTPRGERKGKRPIRNRSQTSTLDNTVTTNQSSQQGSRRIRRAPTNSPKRSEERSSSRDRSDKNCNGDRTRTKRSSFSSSSAIREKGQMNSKLRRSRSSSHDDREPRIAVKDVPRDGDFSEEKHMNSFQSSSNNSTKRKCRGTPNTPDRERHSETPERGRGRSRKLEASSRPYLTADTWNEIIFKSLREVVDLDSSQSRIRSKSDDRNRNRRQSNHDPLAATIRDELVDESIRSRNLEHLVTPIRDPKTRIMTSRDDLSGMEGKFEIPKMPFQRRSVKASSPRKISESSGRRTDRKSHSASPSPRKASRDRERDRRRRSESDIQRHPKSEPSVSDTSKHPKKFIRKAHAPPDDSWGTFECSGYSAEESLSPESVFKVIDSKSGDSKSSNYYDSSWQSYSSSVRKGNHATSGERRGRRGSHRSIETTMKERQERKSEILASLDRETSEDNEKIFLRASPRRTKSGDAPKMGSISKRNNSVRSMSEERVGKTRLRPPEKRERPKATKKKNMSLRKEWEKMKRENEQNFVAFEKSFPVVCRTRVK